MLLLYDSMLLLYDNMFCLMIGCRPSFLISGYVTDVLDDAKVYSGHAGKKTIDTEDVRLAVQCKMDHSFTTPPPRDVCKFVFILDMLF